MADIDRLTLDASQSYMGLSGDSDFPHEVDWNAPADRMVPACFSDQKRHYDFTQSSSPSEVLAQTYLQFVTICPKPYWFNSGAHRVIFYGQYKGIPIVLAGEKQEGLNCHPTGNNIFIGYYGGIDENQSHPFQNEGDVIARTFYQMFTGKSLFEMPAVEDAPPQFSISFEDAQTLVDDNACRLTFSANVCFLNRVADLAGF